MRYGTWRKPRSFANRALTGSCTSDTVPWSSSAIRSGARELEPVRKPGLNRIWGVELRVNQPWGRTLTQARRCNFTGATLWHQVPSSRTLEDYTRFLSAARGPAASAELGERWRQPCDRIWPSSWIRAALAKIWRASEYFPGAWEVERQARDLFSLDWRRLRMWS